MSLGLREQIDGTRRPVLLTMAIVCNVLWSYIVMHLSEGPNMQDIIPFYLGFALAAIAILLLPRFVKTVLLTGWHCLVIAMAMSMATMALLFFLWQTNFERGTLVAIASFIIAIVDVASVTVVYIPLLMRSSRMTVMVAVLIAHVVKRVFAEFYPAMPIGVTAVLAAFILPAIMACCVTGGVTRGTQGNRSMTLLGKTAMEAVPKLLWAFAISAAVAVVICDFISGSDIWVFGISGESLYIGGPWAGIAECAMGAIAAVATVYFGRERQVIARYQPFFCTLFVALVLWLAMRYVAGIDPIICSAVLQAIAVYAHILLWVITYDFVHDGRLPLLAGYSVIFLAQALAILAWHISEWSLGSADATMILLSCVVIIAALMIPAIDLWQPSAYGLSSVPQAADSVIADTRQKADTETETELALSLRRRCDECSKRFGLSERENEVLFLLAQGRTRQAIMDRLVISEGTARTHISHVYTKMGIHSQGELSDMVYEREAKDGGFSESRM